MKLGLLGVCHITLSFHVWMNETNKKQIPPTTARAVRGIKWERYSFQTMGMYLLTHSYVSFEIFIMFCLLVTISCQQGQKYRIHSSINKCSFTNNNNDKYNCIRVKYIFILFYFILQIFQNIIKYLFINLQNFL